MANRIEIFVDVPGMYALTEDDHHNLYLEVMSGGLAIQEVVVALNENEMAMYKRDGKPFLDALSRQIAMFPQDFLHRRIR